MYLIMHMIYSNVLSTEWESWGLVQQQQQLPEKFGKLDDKIGYLQNKIEQMDIELQKKRAFSVADISGDVHKVGWL